MTDEQIQELIATFLDARGGFASASKSQLFDLVKQAVAVERASLLDVVSRRLGMSIDTMLEYMPELTTV